MASAGCRGLLRFGGFDGLDRCEGLGANEDKSKPQGLKPLILWVFNAWAKAQAYPRSKSKDSDALG
jgi:hypothetical protein